MLISCNVVLKQNVHCTVFLWYLLYFFLYFLAKGTLSEDTIASFLRQIGKIIIPDK